MSWAHICKCGCPLDYYEECCPDCLRPNPKYKGHINDTTIIEEDLPHYDTKDKSTKRYSSREDKVVSTIVVVLTITIYLGIFILRSIWSLIINLVKNRNYDVNSR